MPFGAQRSESVSGIRARGSVRLTCCRHLPRQHHSGNGPQTLRADHPVPRHQHRHAPAPIQLLRRRALRSAAQRVRAHTQGCVHHQVSRGVGAEVREVLRRQGPLALNLDGSILCALSAWLGRALRDERSRMVRHRCCVRGVVRRLSRLLLRRSCWQGVLRVRQESTAVPDASPTVARACSTRAFVDSWLTAAKVAHR